MRSYFFVNFGRTDYFCYDNHTALYYNNYNLSNCFIIGVYTDKINKNINIYKFILKKSK